MNRPSDAVTFEAVEEANADTLIALALAEDLGEAGDVTSAATIPAGLRGSARFVTRSEGVVSGLRVIERLVERVGLQAGFSMQAGDGARVAPGEVLATVSGPMRSILGIERIALNFLQRLSGVATLTSKYVARVAGTKAQILDTRKTTPGWRYLEKYAVRCGGGKNHREGLFDAVLIKDNHLAALAGDPDPIGRAIASAREFAPDAVFVEVEVDSLAQFDRALECAADIILLDNLGPTDLIEAVRRRDASSSSTLLEASGGITFETVLAVALSGVDLISVGALTHSAPALDIGLDYGGLVDG